MKHVARWFSKVRLVLVAVLAYVAPWVAVAWRFGAENARELVFAFGLSLVAYGLSIWSVAAAYIVPGSILVWLAIPPAVKRSK